VLSVLRFTDFDYPFGIFKIVLEKTEGVIKNGKLRDTGNIGYTRLGDKLKENTKKQPNKMCDMDPTKIPVGPRSL
jgi:hypothetical protein